MRDINNWRYDIVKPLFITEFLPSEKKQDSSHWRKRKISIGSSFKRGKELLIYRKKVLQDAKQ